MSFITKQINELREMADSIVDTASLGDSLVPIRTLSKMLCDAASTIEELSAKVRGENGWISIEDGLPPAGVPLIVTVHTEDQSRPDEIAYPVMYQKDMRRSNRWVWWDYMSGNEIGPSYFTVTAWKRFPEPYKGNGRGDAV